MKEHDSGSPHDSQADEPRTNDGDKEASRTRSDPSGTPKESPSPTGAGRESNPYDKLPYVPRDADGEVF